MTIVTCDDQSCYYHKEGTCTAEKINIEDNFCDTQTDYTKLAPEYQNEYWIAVKGDSPEKLFRKKRKGIMYKFKDLILYTEDDIREGVKEAYFTEKTTGYACGSGVDLEKNYKLIKEQIAKVPPVLSLPEAQEDDQKGINTTSDYPF